MRNRRRQARILSARSRDIATPRVGIIDTLGIMGSLESLEAAQELEPHIVEFLEGIRDHARMPDEVKPRIDALVARHKPKSDVQLPLEVQSVAVS